MKQNLQKPTLPVFLKESRGALHPKASKKSGLLHFTEGVPFDKWDYPVISIQPEFQIELC